MNHDRDGIIGAFDVDDGGGLFLDNVDIQVGSFFNYNSAQAVYFNLS